MGGRPLPGQTGDPGRVSSDSRINTPTIARTASAAKGQRNASPMTKTFDAASQSGTISKPLPGELGTPAQHRTTGRHPLFSVGPMTTVAVESLLLSAAAACGGASNDANILTPPWAFS